LARPPVPVVVLVLAVESLAADVVLDQNSYYRYFIAWRTEFLRKGDGSLEPIDDKGKGPAPVVASELPPANWAAPDFDDSAWARHRGPLKASATEMSLICIRARFEASDPAKAGELRLSAAFTAGGVLYVNGVEVARVGLPKGAALDAEAEDLPKEAYLDPDGNLYRIGWGDEKKFEERQKARLRALDAVKIPATVLRKGVNVVALEVHRAPASELLLTVKPLRWREEQWRGRSYYWWPRLGFESLRLTGGGEGVAPNVARPPRLQVWNHSLLDRPLTSDWGDPTEPLRPLRFAGPRGAVLSQVVCVGSPGAIKGSQVTAEVTLPGAAIEVRYLQADGDVRDSFGSLVAEAPASKAVQPVWLRLRVPRDAKPGEYAGKVTVRCEGAEPVVVPLTIKVYDWTMPEPQGFTAHVGLIQSPDSLAMHYGVEVWSDAHWKLIERSFQLLGEVGNKVVFIPAIRRTHFGNEHGMVRWIKTDGGYRHDFSIAEKYLDLALKHQGKPQAVCLYCWEYYTGGKYLDHKAKGGGKGMCFTVLDPKTGKLEEAEGPHWGEPAVREFWKPVMDGFRELLAKRGIEQAMMIGVAGDTRPTKEAGEDLLAAAPMAKWVVHSHATADKLWGMPVGYLCDVWGAPQAPDPPKRLYGWHNPFLRATFPRAGSNTVGSMHPNAPLAMWYLSLEAMQAAGIHGFGRVGADFWPVVPGPENRKKPILGRFPESTWGQLGVQNSASWVLAPGKDGALPTLRFEMIRSAQQQAEARIFIERALTDPAKRAKLGDDLGTRAQKLLDDRIRVLNYARSRGWDYFPSSGWQAREEALYAAAAEVAKALGGN